MTLVIHQYVNDQGDLVTHLYDPETGETSTEVIADIFMDESDIPKASEPTDM